MGAYVRASCETKSASPRRGGRTTPATPEREGGGTERREEDEKSKPGGALIKESLIGQFGNFFHPLLYWKDETDVTFFASWDLVRAECNKPSMSGVWSGTQGCCGCWAACCSDTWPGTWTRRASTATAGWTPPGTIMRVSSVRRTSTRRTPPCAAAPARCATAARPRTRGSTRAAAPTTGRWTTPSTLHVSLHCELTDAWTALTKYLDFT